MRPLFSSLISRAKQSFCETFHGFDGLAPLRLGVVVVQIVSRNRNAYLKRAIVDVHSQCGSLSFMVAGARARITSTFGIGVTPSAAQRGPVVHREFRRRIGRRPAPQRTDGAR
jgi:hypothetical protein